MKKSCFLLILFFCVQIVYSQHFPDDILTGRLVRLSPKLTDIVDNNPVNTKTPKPEDPKSLALRANINKRVRFSSENPNAKSSDEAIQKEVKSGIQFKTSNSLIGTFEGAGTLDNTAVGFPLFSPPDPVMAVGPNHVVQMINSVHKVFNKAGTVLTGPLKLSAIASTSTDNGDPIALYDHIADRWLLLQFSSLFTNGSESLIFCISQTSDPTGAYFVYEFRTPGKFPDYPHVGIWNNSYVVTTHNFNTAGTAYLGQGYWAFDRTKMVNGEPTVTAIGFQDASTAGYLPASFEGFKTPDVTSHPMFVTFDADEFGGVDQLQLRTLTPNFANPASSVLSAVTNLPTAAFDARNPNPNAIEQQGTTSNLDQLADRMMSRIIYRRFDNYESMVMNYVVNVSGVNPTAASTYQAAKRWYELTRPNSVSPWTINQQSTYSPTAIDGATGINRWMGSVGIDQKGNMALGYSRASTTNFPDIYFAERKKTDPLNTLGAEQLFHASGGSQTSTGGRWGDYSAMSTDPTDEETMWFTAEYYANTANVNFKTRVGSFKINDPAALPAIHFEKGGTIARQKESTTPLPPNRFYKDHPITIKIDQAPTQAVNITINKSGTATEGVDYDFLNAASLILNSATLTQTFTLRIYDNALGEVNEFIDVDYTLNVNGGNAVAATYNQKHRITIIGTQSCPSSLVAIVRPATFCEGDSAILNANTNPDYTFQWFKNNSLIGGATQFQLIAKESGVYRVEVTRFGCTISSTEITVLVKIGAPFPATISRSILFGTTITSGNGLQASALCPINQTTTYTGPIIGYDNNTKSGLDPTVNVTGAGSSLGKVKVSITWRKRSGGGINDCGTVGGTGTPFYNEVSFKIQSPTGTIINLLNTNNYGSGAGTPPLASITTVFEDGGLALGPLPSNGGFNPASPLAALIGTNPTGTWTLLANDNGVTDPLCVMSFSVTIVATGAGGASTITWHDAASGGAQVGSGLEFIPSNTTVGIYTYYAQATCSALTECINSIRKPATLTISALTCGSVGGLVTSDVAICSGNNTGTLTLAGHTGSILRWESSINNFVTIVSIPNTTNSQVYLNLTQSIKYRAVVKDGACPEANSTAANLTISDPSVAGTVTTDAAVCTGINGGTLTLTGQTGSVLRWESSTDNFVTILTIPNITTTQNYSNLTQTSKFRAIVKNGVCPEANSTSATITVSSNTMGGAVNSDATVCIGSNGGTLNLVGYTGSILRWESSVDNFTTIVIIANTSSTQNYLNLTQTTKYRAIVKNGVCPEVNAIPATIIVSTTVVVAGTVTSNASVCAGINVGTLTLSGHLGAIVGWESSIDNFSTIVAIANTTTTQNYSNLTQTTKFRAIVEGLTCGDLKLPVGQGYASAATITVNPIPIAIASSDQAICSGSSTTLSATCALLSVSTSLSGVAEVPPNASVASGSVLGTFNPITNQLNLSITFSGLAANATGAHIHKAIAGVNGPVQIGFSGVPSALSGTLNYSGILTSAQATDLLAGLYYVNIHSSSFPGGEIRGQLSSLCVANSFVWNPGALNGATVIVNPSLTTIYTLIATNTTSGCSSTASTTVTVVPLPTASNTGPYLVGQTISLNSTTGASNSWFGPNAFTSSQANPSIANAQLNNAGIYIVTVSNPGCTATSTTNVVVSVGIDPCVQIMTYYYVQAGAPFQTLFPLTNGLNIAKNVKQTSIIVKPICNAIPIESVQMNITGPYFLNWTILQSYQHFSLYDNADDYILGSNLAAGSYTLMITGYAQKFGNGGITYGPVVTNFNIIENPPTISTPTIVGTQFCANSNVTVNFSTTGTFGPGNVFQVLLSDVNGSFNNSPEIIGTTNVVGSIFCTIPSTILGGENYRVKIISTDLATSGNNNLIALTLNPLLVNLVSPTNDFSSGTITKQAAQFINAKNSIYGVSNIQYKAGNAINLTPGFQVVSSPGSSFKVSIGGCN